jgi:hypothetical protein
MEKPYSTPSPSASVTGATDNVGDRVDTTAPDAGDVVASSTGIGGGVFHTIETFAENSFNE